MPSDPLPLSPAGKALATTVEELLGVQFKSNEAYRGWLATADRLAIAIEQEARTLARAEVIAEIEALPGTEQCFCEHDRRVYEGKSDLYLNKEAVLAALSRLGERE